MGIVDRRRHTLALARRKATLARLRRRGRRGTLTLVYSTPDIDDHNDAVATADFQRRDRRATKGPARS
jgi:hypothetical protein